MDNALKPAADVGLQIARDKEYNLVAILHVLQMKGMPRFLQRISEFFHRSQNEDQANLFADLLHRMYVDVFLLMAKRHFLQLMMVSCHLKNVDQVNLSVDLKY